MPNETPTYRRKSPQEKANRRSEKMIELTKKKKKERSKRGVKTSILTIKKEKEIVRGKKFPVTP